MFGSICNVYSLRLIGVTRSLPISNASPLFAILFSYLLLGETIQWQMLPGTLIFEQAGRVAVEFSVDPADGADHSAMGH